MIRELTKSALSFSWALSLLGLKQAANLGTFGRQNSDVLSPVTQVAVSQLDESMKGLYRTGESLQSRVIDMAFGSMNAANWTPGRNVTQTTAGPSAQAGSRPSAPDPAFWMNPFNWFNPATWNVMCPTGSCGQPGSGSPSQTSGQTSDGASVAGPPTGWGPMPGKTP